MESSSCGNVDFVTVGLGLKMLSLSLLKETEGKDLHHWTPRAPMLILYNSNAHALQKQQHDTLHGERKTLNGNDL